VTIRFGRTDVVSTRRSRWRRFIPGWKLRWGTAGLIVGTVLVALFVLAVFFMPKWIDPRPAGLGHLRLLDRIQAELSLDEARNAVRTALIQALGGALVLLTVAVGIGQLLVSREGQVVDRFTNAVEQLGSKDVDVRLGGIFALQQIAERADYARPVAEILVAYLKTHAREATDTDAEKAPEVSVIDSAGRRVRLRPDLQAALLILGQERLRARAKMGRLDLSFLDVRYADLEGVDLSGVILLGSVLDGSNLRGAKLERADLRQASLASADLSQANLSGVDLSRADLTSARLDNARLDGSLLREAVLRQASMKLAHLTDTDLSRADLSGALLSAARLDRASLVDANFEGSDLSGATLGGANLDAARWTGARLVGAVLDDDMRRTIERDAPPNGIS
jgi:uncharacterized protein YjbI with pentapeptide repeats